MKKNNLTIIDITKLEGKNSSISDRTFTSAITVGTFQPLNLQTMGAAPVKISPLMLIPDELELGMRNYFECYRFLLKNNSSV